MSDEKPIRKAELLRKINAGWDELQARIQSWGAAELTGPTDAAGWTGKDHLMHLAVWEDSIVAVLTGHSRRERMGVSEALWNGEGFDAINAAIQQQHKDKSLDEVLQALKDVHNGMMSALEPMTDADLQRPYSSFQPPRKGDGPIVDWIVGDTYGHYEQHIEWIDAIVR